jgi:hypothetical protein
VDLRLTGQNTNEGIESFVAVENVAGAPWADTTTGNDFEAAA